MTHLLVETCSTGPAILQGQSPNTTGPPIDITYKDSFFCRFFPSLFLSVICFSLCIPFNDNRTCNPSMERYLHYICIMYNNIIHIMWSFSFFVSCPIILALSFHLSFFSFVVTFKILLNIQYLHVGRTSDISGRKKLRNIVLYLPFESHCM